MVKRFFHPEKLLRRTRAGKHRWVGET